MFISGAERFPAGKTDADYILALKNVLNKYSHMLMSIEKDVYAEPIGGIAFSAIDFKTNFSGVIVSQKYYAHIIKDYILFFIITYQTEEQLKKHAEILKSVALQ